MDNVSYGFICIALLIIGTLMSLYWYYTSQSHITKRLRRFFGDIYSDSDYWNKDD